MQLSTPEFFVFFLVMWALYWALAGQRHARLAVLFAANLFFLSKFGWVFLLLPVAATVDWLVGLGLGRTGGMGREADLSSAVQDANARKVVARVISEAGRRRWLLAISLVLNVGLLVAAKMLPVATGDRYAWLLGLSLSFYCFQSLTYTIDLFRRDEDAVATRNWLAYVASATFFPTMIAGPILRLHKFLREVTARPTLTREMAGRAFLLIGIGLVKKILVADYLSENLVTRVFDTPTLYSGLEVLAAVYGYALQLFFDFSGYTDIALGAGLLLGVVLPENFNRPYLSASVADFWRRWHMSFSFWLRDYIQERLPQRRRTWPMASYCYSVIFTMLLGGLWHGFAWTFLVWGALHGVALAVNRVWKNKRRGRKPTRAGTAVAVFVTFHFVCFTWIFFHASSLQNAGDVLARLGSLGSGAGWSHDNLTVTLVAVLIGAFLAQCLPLEWLNGSAGLLARTPFWVQGAALAGLVLLIQSIAGRGAATFIYGSF